MQRSRMFWFRMCKTQWPRPELDQSYKSHYFCLMTLKRVLNHSNWKKIYVFMSELICDKQWLLLCSQTSVTAAHGGLRQQKQRVTFKWRAHFLWAAGLRRDASQQQHRGAHLWMSSTQTHVKWLCQSAIRLHARSSTDPHPDLSRFSAPSPK